MTTAARARLDGADPLHPNRIAQLATALREWGLRYGRTTSWRLGSSQYGLAAAEILLQKTKAQDAESVWQQLIASYPTACALAAAAPHAVEQIVAELGLRTQRTARLQSMATVLCQGNSTGKVPGLGPYGSAILALNAGHEPTAPPVDGNIARVVSRVGGLTFERGEPRKKQSVKAAVSALLATATCPADKLAIVYALVDLGATVCKPGVAGCQLCPLSPNCASAATACG